MENLCAVSPTIPVGFFSTFSSMNRRATSPLALTILVIVNYPRMHCKHMWTVLSTFSSSQCKQISISLSTYQWFNVNIWDGDNESPELREESAHYCGTRRRKLYEGHRKIVRSKH